MNHRKPCLFRLLLPTLALLLLTGCAPEEETTPIDMDTPPLTETAVETPIEGTLPIETTEITETPSQPTAPTGAELSAAITALPDSDSLRQADIADMVTAERLDTLSPEKRTELGDALAKTDSLTAFRREFHRITGYTFHGWREALAGGSHVKSPHTDGTASLVFTGDVCLGDEWYNMLNYHQKGSAIENNITAEVRGWLSAADVALMNCECTLSDRGEPTPGKLYTFRGKPENAEIFAALGVDIVSLANNHAHDYGRDAFLDTMAALESAGVTHVGAGAVLDEAMAYRSFVADGMKIAYVAASNAEKYRLTPGATADSPGILLMYDETNVLTALDKAAREADVVVVYVHWGTENSAQVNRNQQDLRDAFIAHGADVIVGSHPHVLQPWEVVNGVPVVYSLGNFWFNMETLDTALAYITVGLSETGVTAACELFACIQSGGVTGFAHEFGG